MQRSYLVKSSVNFADFGFFVKVGDILVHDPSNNNKLTVYRNGTVIRDVKQTSLGLAAMVKNSFIVEVTGQAPAPKTAPKAPQKPIKAAPAPGVPISKPEFDKLKEDAKKPTKEEIEQKRKKAHPTEVSIDDAPRLKEALAARKPKPLDLEETEL
jgi:hypothetical protein